MSNHKIKFNEAVTVNVQQLKTISLDNATVRSFSVESEYLYGEKPINGPAPLLEERRQVALFVETDAGRFSMLKVLYSDQAALLALLDTAGYEATLEALFNAAIASGDYNK